LKFLSKILIFRLGLVEMMSFSKLFLGAEVKESTFFESCGVADLITTCYGGRNRKVSEAFAKTGKTLEVLEAEMLNGQKLQGPETARELQGVLKAKGIDGEKFPLFTAVYKCCYEGMPVANFLSALENV
jgi:glycerol-3-phosphate dehydrogenase (NAD+)